jgi:hypoxanthine phosphoribosyltransferase
VQALAAEIVRDLGDGPLHLIGILKGSVPFLADLARALPLEEVTVDFLSASSYGNAAESSGDLVLRQDLEDPVQGRQVLLVEDIVDTGHTLQRLRRHVADKGPASLRVVALLDKPGSRVVPVDVEYIGFCMRDHFLVGYGLDYAGRYRHLPYIGALRPEVYKGERR